MPYVELYYRGKQPTKVLQTSILLHWHNLPFNLQTHIDNISFIHNNHNTQRHRKYGIIDEGPGSTQRTYVVMALTASRYCATGGYGVVHGGRRRACLLRGCRRWTEAGLSSTGCRRWTEARWPSTELLTGDGVETADGGELAFLELCSPVVVVVD